MMTAAEVSSQLDSIAKITVFFSIFIQISLQNYYFFRKCANKFAYIN
jgi:hypothetical protein